MKIQKNQKIQKNYPKSPILTVDGLLVAKDKILLTKRNIFPFKGYWVLPGGHVEYKETLKKALKREIKEELGIDVKIGKIIGAFSGLKRDPRYHTVSVAYEIFPKNKKQIKLNFEASQYKFFSFNKLPKKIGFDHLKIIKEYLKKYGGKNRDR